MEAVFLLISTRSPESAYNVVPEVCLMWSPMVSAKLRYKTQRGKETLRNHSSIYNVRLFCLTIMYKNNSGFD